MNKKLIIYGAGKIAEVILYYAKEECGYDIAAITVDGKYKTAETLHNIPVIAFEEIEKNFPPSKYDMFIAVGYHDLNELRENRCREAVEKGYRLVSIISPLANVPKNVITGVNCFIMPPAIIHPFVTIGNNVFVWSGTMIGHHSVIKDNCWLTSACNISGNVTVGENTFIAVNATIGHSVTVGKDCFLGANSLVTKNIEDGNVMIEESTKPFRLNSKQFLRISSFSNL
jgi:sugar O-acyltransferase (sialic acid O-acetyltransferase NeuD family)